MTIKVSLFLLSILCTFSLQASEFNGVWSGKGFINSLDDRTSIEALFQVKLELDQSSLILEQCSLDLSGNGAQECISSHYEVENESIYNQRGQKIGDIYPEKIIIFESSTQFSEQFLIALNNDGEMRYNYTFTSFEGNNVYMRSYLLKDTNDEKKLVSHK